MGNILNKLHSWYEKYIKHSQVRVEHILPTDMDFHADKIRRYGDNLRDTRLPLEDRAKAAFYIGLLTYTGGITISVPASEYIQDMIDILATPNTLKKVRIAVLKGLCGICYINYTNQISTRELNLTDILLACLDEDEDEDEDEESVNDQDVITVKFWICYLMTVVSCNNLPYLRLFQDSGGQMLEDRLETLSAMEWFGWPANYAEVMFTLLGYQKVTLD